MPFLLRGRPHNTQELEVFVCVSMVHDHHYEHLFYFANLQCTQYRIDYLHYLLIRMYNTYNLLCSPPAIASMNLLRRCGRVPLSYPGWSPPAFAGLRPASLENTKTYARLRRLFPHHCPFTRRNVVKLWTLPGSNRSPLRCKRSALPDELRAHKTSDNSVPISFFFVNIRRYTGLHNHDILPYIMYILQ